MNDQQAVTRAFVAEHLIAAHRTHPNDAQGCMICASWTWARETRLMDNAAVKKMLEEVQPVIGVTHVPSRVEA